MGKRKRYVPDLIADMAECDANFIRLQRLFPRMQEDDVLEFGVVAPAAGSELAQSLQGRPSGEDGPEAIPADGAVVTIKVEQRCVYTTMLVVKVENEEDKPWVRWPHLQVRVYHDIKTAEVVSFERHRNLKFRYATPNAQMFQPDEKSQINRFFGELLTYCYENGHSLETVNIRG